MSGWPASVYRLLKASPAFIVIEAADAFKDKTTTPNQLRQTDFTYLKVIGWGWFYLSTVLDDFSPATSSPGSCAGMFDFFLRANSTRIFVSNGGPNSSGARAGCDAVFGRGGAPRGPRSGTASGTRSR